MLSVKDFLNVTDKNSKFSKFEVLEIRRWDRLWNILTLTHFKGIQRSIPLPKFNISNGHLFNQQNIMLKNIVDTFRIILWIRNIITSELQ